MATNILRSFAGRYATSGFQRQPSGGQDRSDDLERLAAAPMSDQTAYWPLDQTGLSSALKAGG